MNSMVISALPQSWTAARRGESGAHPGKVPQVTLMFWVIKIIATTLGETGGDWVSMTLRVGYAWSSLVFVTLMGIALYAQMRARRFHPALYWTVIVATTTAGTTMADFADRSLGIGYTGGSVMLAVLLLASLGMWRLVTGSVDVASVRSARPEMFYWVTILFSQTLGTALGDRVALVGDIGYVGGAVVFGVLLAVIAGLALLTSVSRTLLFWSAFILTRPLGATLGDFLDKPVASGGLAFSRLTASAMLAIAIVALVTLTAERRRPWRG